MISDLTPKGQRQFRFVVIADTHINPSDSSASSFFELNRLANGRAAAAIPAAARYEPDFMLHLGDIVHPLPSHPEYALAAEKYRSLTQMVVCPIYLTPGNHDVGDKPWPLAPVAQIDDHAMQAYEREFGAQWQSWEHQGCHFFIINTSLLNSGLPQEHEQREWFERELRKKTEGRKFLALHYPPYVMSSTEQSNYDNINEPARNWLLSLIEEYSVEAVFCGHVHNLWYDQYAASEIYLLPSTAFVRQDYSEMQRVRPVGEEGGRQDIDKLGFFVVDVFEQGHIAAFVRLDENAERQSEQEILNKLIHTKAPLIPNLGVDPAYPWAEEITIPPSGALDAFDSKYVRNDYPIFSAMEIGISRLRVSLADLSHHSNLDRLHKLVRIGFRVQIVVTELPNAQQRTLFRGLGQALESVEYVASEQMIRANAPLLRELAKDLGVATLTLSKLRSPADAEVDGLNYGHLVFQGWVPQEVENINALRKEEFARVLNLEFLYRVRFCESPLEYAKHVAQLRDQTGCAGAMMLRLATDNPAQEQQDENASSTYIVETVIASILYPDMRFTLDCLIDFDRGYFLRKGLFDRSFNPRNVVPILRHLSVLLCGSQQSWALENRIEHSGHLEIRLSSERESVVVALRKEDISNYPELTFELPELDLDAEHWDLLTGRKMPAHEAVKSLAYFRRTKISANA